ncbi:hypothetical protein E3J79_00415 [Candidatus Dependentiae bacterium]|nr:MAG: hypothetical protein E3J79_00415 [Candidatus Dependentiae bacterium]
MTLLNVYSLEKKENILKLKEVKHTKQMPRNSKYLLAADIGGTNFTFALMQIKKGKPVIFVSFHGKSAEIDNPELLTKELLDHIHDIYGITVKHACFAIAGIVSVKKDFGRLTNVPLQLNAHEIKKRTGLKIVFIINDSEANGYAIDIVPKESIKIIKSQKKIPHRKNKILLGAGTGLGKSILIWDHFAKQHIPSASEGGHADFPVHNRQELELLEFIKKFKKLPKKVSIEWEDLLSGSGLQSIYLYLNTIKQYKRTSYQDNIEHNTYDPYFISLYRKKDAQCRDTYQFFTKFYARCAKNFALDSLALAGIYFTGGIAAGNPDIFMQRIFWNEFINTRKQVTLLKQIPIYVITDTTIGLYGAAIYLLFHQNVKREQL